MTVKYLAEIETSTEYTGYLVNGNIIVPIEPNNKDYIDIQKWIEEGNTPEDAYTQQELDDYTYSQNLIIPSSMKKEGKKLTYDNLIGQDIGLDPIIEDKPAHDAWMQELYADETAMPKPPPTERQKLAIEDESRDAYTFTRYHDQWGYRWRLVLFRPDVNALAIAIYDSQGNYLYTTGALIDTGNDSWYTECPAGQADATPENVYFRWLLGSANISSLESYNGADETKEGFVRSDERYD